MSMEPHHDSQTAPSTASIPAVLEARNLLAGTSPPGIQEELR